MFLRCAKVLAPIVCAVALMMGTAMPASVERGDGQWDPTLPKVVSSGAPSDPVAMANASFQASQLALQTTLDE